MEKIKVGQLIVSGLKVLLEKPVIFLLSLIVYLPTLSMGLSPKSNLILLVYIVAGYLVTTYVTALVIKYISTGKEDAGWGALLKFAFRKYLPMLAVFFIYYMIVLAGSLLLIIPGIFFLVRLILCDYGIMLEDEGIGGSIKRSWNITKGNWWRLFILMLALGAAPVFFSFFQKLMPPTVFAAGSLVLGVLSYAWMQSSFILAYFELRKNLK